MPAPARLGGEHVARRKYGDPETVPRGRLSGGAVCSPALTDFVIMACGRAS